MSALDQIRAAADAGLRPKFGDLPEAARIQLTDTLVPRGRAFTAEERALFGGYVLELDATAKASIEAHNASGEPHKVPLLTQSDGTTAIPSDLLTWCGPGDGYHALQALLWTLPIVPYAPLSP